MSTKDVRLDFSKVGGITEVGIKRSRKAYLKKVAPLLKKCIRDNRKNYKLDESTLYIKVKEHSWRQSHELIIRVKTPGIKDIVCTLELSWDYYHEPRPKVELTFGHHKTSNYTWSHYVDALNLSKIAQGTLNRMVNEVERGRNKVLWAAENRSFQLEMTARLRKYGVRFRAHGGNIGDLYIGGAETSFKLAYKEVHISISNLTPAVAELVCEALHKLGLSHNDYYDDNDEELDF